MRDIDEILSYWHRTGSIQGTASSLGVHRGTVRKYAAIARAHGYDSGRASPPEGWLAFVRVVMPQAIGRTQPSEAAKRIEVFHEGIVEGLAQTKAAIVWQRLKDEAGLEASLTSFYRYVRQHIPQYKASKGITIRREDFSPGDVAEVDFGTLGLWWDPIEKRRRKLHAFVMVLGHSRHMFVWVTPVMDQKAWVLGHVEAFSFFGGAPSRVVLDNLKDGVLKADIYDPKFNRTYEEMARHYSFIVDPARARKPKDKPIVERMISYVRNNFWKGRSFESIQEVNSKARTWCLEVAGRRNHGTTGLQPLTHFSTVEQPAMKPLPLEPFEMATWTTARVGPDCHIQAGRSLYSIPYIHVGKTLDVRLTNHMIQCFLDEELVKVHRRVVPGKRSTDWNDYPPEKAKILRENPEWCRRRSQEMGDSIAWAVGTLLDGHAQHYLRQARGILRLAEQYGGARVEAACARAKAFGDPAYRTVKGILERGLDQAAPAAAIRTSPAGAFLRGASALLWQDGASD